MHRLARTGANSTKRQTPDMGSETPEPGVSVAGVGDAPRGRGQYSQPAALSPHAAVRRACVYLVCGMYSYALMRVGSALPCLVTYAYIALLAACRRGGAAVASSPCLACWADPRFSAAMLRYTKCTVCPRHAAGNMERRQQTASDAGVWSQWPECPLENTGFQWHWPPEMEGQVHADQDVETADQTNPLSWALENWLWCAMKHKLELEAAANHRLPASGTASQGGSLSSDLRKEPRNRFLVSMSSEPLSVCDKNIRSPHRLHKHRVCWPPGTSPGPMRATRVHNPCCAFGSPCSVLPDAPFGRTSTQASTHGGRPKCQGAAPVRHRRVYLNKATRQRSYDDSQDAAAVDTAKDGAVVVIRVWGGDA